MIVIVDYGVGNLGALVNMFEYLGFDCETSRDPKTIAAAGKLVLPGVGAFDKAMRNLHDYGLVQPLSDAVLGRGTPVLGVCLGMQLLGEASEEGSQPGLGWIAARSLRIRPPIDAGLKVPHIGWSDVIPRCGSPLFAVSSTNPRFYFSHSYHMQCRRDEHIAAMVEYGGELCCAVAAGNIHGVQFHPEKSHRHGMAILKAFAAKT